MTIDAVHRPVAPSVAEASATAQASPARPAAKIETKPGPLVQFEAFVLQSFIQSIMPQDASAVFGEGTSGEVWKSMMAEKIAMQVAQAGGIGIAKMIAPKPNMVPAGSPLTPMNSSSAGRLLDMQAGSAQASGVATTALTSLGTMAAGPTTNKK